MLNPYFKSVDKDFYLLQGDTMDLLPQFDHKFDMVMSCSEIPNSSKFHQI